MDSKEAKDTFINKSVESVEQKSEIESKNTQETPKSSLKRPASTFSQDVPSTPNNNSLKARKRGEFIYIFIYFKEQTLNTKIHLLRHPSLKTSQTNNGHHSSHFNIPLDAN